MDFPQTADLNLRLLRPLVRYLADYYGRSELERIAAASRLDVRDLDGATRWTSLEQFESVLAHARKLMPDEPTFLKACSYELDEPRGPIRFLMGAISPAAAYEIGAKNMRLISTISQFEAEKIQRGEIRIRYRSTKRESRLMCLSRQAQIINLPKLWGLPLAHLTEETCGAHGDECCSYHVRVYEARRWVSAALGLAAGAVLWVAMRSGGQILSPAWLLVTALVGYLYDQRVASNANRRTQEGINSAYLQMARDDAHARQELFELTHRQKTWGHLMEDEVVDRSDRLHQLVAEVERLQPSQVVRLRRAPQDADNPLHTIRSGLEQLRGLSESEANATLDRLGQSVGLLDRKLGAIARLASAAPNLVSLRPRTVSVAPLAEDLNNRLKALVRGKDVRVSVFTVRDAPERITIDIVLFNRIVDNLLLNAAQYTDHGSIVVEVGGTPEFLTVKVSDTGGNLRGDEVGKLFRPMARGPAGFGYGAGLSVVVQLLASIGGKLDVMAHTGRGTTFWAHFPLQASGAPPQETPKEESSERDPNGTLGELVNQVVTFRKSEGG